MSGWFATPLLVVAAATGLAAAAESRLRPAMATRTLAVTCVAAAAAWLWTLLALVLASLAAMGGDARWMSWCPNLYFADDHVPLIAGVGAGVALVASAAFALRRLTDAISDRRMLPECGPSGVLVLNCDEPTAFAVPGRRGGVVVSRGLIDALEVEERSIVWAHERAHLRHRHHWYLGAADLAAAVLPVLRPLARRVHLGTERWADEDSVPATGDRRLVARTIAKAALATSDHQQMRMAMATSAVPARVEALISPSRSDLGTVVGAMVAGTLAALTVGGSTIQLHHLVALVEHVCGGR
ncbi:MAG TPA: M56 family metallopeptidase [Microthrixaceae bacterium]|nr:M56 family metallopeptidase [Microthrixaceae bacterium]